VAQDFEKELAAKGLQTIRQRVRDRGEMTVEDALASWFPGSELPTVPQPECEPAMQVQVPSETLTGQWKLGAWHILRHSPKDEKGKRQFNDYPYGVLATETYMILHALDVMGMHQEAANSLDQWLTLPLVPSLVPGKPYFPTPCPDRPLGYFSDGQGCLTHAVGPDGFCGNMDGVHATGPGAIMFTLSEHFRLTGDLAWLKANAPRMKANAEWILRQHRLLTTIIPGGDRLWSRGLQPAHVATPDPTAGGLLAQHYITEAYYWLGVKRMAEMLALIAPEEGAKMEAEAEVYRRDLLAAAERSIVLSPVMRVQDGTYRSFLAPFPYCRGPADDAANKWMRPPRAYWDRVQSAGPLISPAGVLAPNDRRVQGFLDVLEDTMFCPKDSGEWYYHGGIGGQVGFERQTSSYLETDDIPCYLRGLYNGYATEVVPSKGYIFMEGASHTSAEDKIFEEAAFLVRFRSMLVTEEGDTLWLARATPRAWLAQGQKISVKNAPTHFGTVAYEIVSDVDNGQIAATVEMPSRKPPKAVLLRLRHPEAAPIQSVTVNGKPWTDFDAAQEVIRLHDVEGTIKVETGY